MLPCVLFIAFHHWFVLRGGLFLFCLRSYRERTPRNQTTFSFPTFPLKANNLTTLLPWTVSRFPKLFHFFPYLHISLPVPCLLVQAVSGFGWHTLVLWACQNQAVLQKHMMLIVFSANKYFVFLLPGHSRDFSVSSEEHRVVSRILQWWMI